MNFRPNSLYTLNPALRYYFAPVGMLSIVMSVFVCLSVCLSVCVHAYLKNTRHNFTKFSLYVVCGCGSVLLWWRCTT